jgi:hypothetical protein
LTNKDGSSWSVGEKMKTLSRMLVPLVIVILGSIIGLQTAPFLKKMSRSQPTLESANDLHGLRARICSLKRVGAALSVTYSYEFIDRNAPWGLGSNSITYVCFFDEKGSEIDGPIGQRCAFEEAFSIAKSRPFIDTINTLLPREAKSVAVALGSSDLITKPIPIAD